MPNGVSSWTEAGNAARRNLVAARVSDEIVRAGILSSGARLEEVTVWEGTRNSVTYRP